MKVILVYIGMALLMVVPVFVGVRLLFVDAALLQEWTGFRAELRTCRRYRWIFQLFGLLLIAGGVYFGVVYVF